MKAQSIRVIIRDGIALARQALELPHNKTSGQVRAAKRRFDQAEIDQQRIKTIAQVFDLELVEIQQAVESQVLIMPSLPKSQHFIGDMMSVRDQLSLHALVYALQPRRVIETGVASGASSTMILEQLAHQSDAMLVSIEIEGPKSAFYGELIPEHLRPFWQLHIQKDQPLLPELLAEIGEIDLFLHDSRHSVYHMLWEYELAWQYLRPGGCLASHDILTTSAFQQFQTQHSSQIVAGASIGNFGFLIKKAAV